MQKHHWLPLLAVLFAACGGDEHPKQSFAGLTRVTGPTPFAGSCGITGTSGSNFAGAEVEPRVAIDPLDAKHMVGVWQQDRWSNGGSRGLGTAVTFDGGLTWTRSALPYTVCSGGTFQRASDPWVSFAPDGTVHQIGYAFSGAQTAMLVSRSSDGGHNWTAPLSIFGEIADDAAIDKETITADPQDARLVYAIWDRLTGINTPDSPNNTGPAVFTRSADGGATWETARVVYDPGPNAQTISNQIVVLPSGVLVDLLVVITNLNAGSHAVETLSVLRSSDKGVTWSPQPVAIAQMQLAGVVDPKQPSNFIRTGDIVPDIAVDRATGAVYVAWEDSRFTGGQREGIAISRSTDEGLTWSAPARVNGVVATQAFTPSIAVAQGGAVGVSYYDFRDDNAGDSSRLLATRWLATSHDGGATFQDTAQGGPFDIRNAPRVTAEGQTGYFVGDYEGLVAVGGSFLPFFVLGNDGDTGNRTDVFARPIASAPAAAALVAAEFVAPRRVRTGLRRVF